MSEKVKGVFDKRGRLLRMYLFLFSSAEPGYSLLFSFAFSGLFVLGDLGYLRFQ